MKQFSRSRRRPSSVTAVAMVAVCGLALASCQADPGDAPTVDDADNAGEDRQRGSGAGGDGEGAAAVPEELRTITVGVDSIPSDLNPHLVGSRSMLTSAVADLTLPSAFEVGADGRRTELNTALFDSVDVLSGDPDAPTKVRYVLAGEAQWSDGTPISGSDFEYLRQQIVTKPGAADTAGYADISDLEVSAGGNTVTVTFARAQDDWRELFAHLLPSHIYGAEGRNFTTLMSALPAASGGVYAVRQFDPGRGNLVLERNTRYWGESPARTDRIVFSVSGSLNTATQMLRAGQYQMLTTRQGAVTDESVSTVPRAGATTTSLDTRLDLVPNIASTRLDSVVARRALLSAVDSDRVARLVTGDPNAEAPSGGAGAYHGKGTEVDLAETIGVTPGDPLRIAADTLDDEAVEAARRVVDQLEDAGLPATVVTPSTADLYSAFLPRGDVDAVVAWQDRERSRNDLRSTYACDRADRPVTSPSQSLPTESDTGTSTGTTTESTTGTTEESDVAGESTSAEPGDEKLTARASNVSGICDGELDGLLDDGSEDQVRDYLADQALALPLVGDSVVVGRSADLSGPRGRIADWPMGERAGPFASVAEWFRVADPDTGKNTDTTGKDQDD